jgi:replicative DNA helicase
MNTSNNSLRATRPVVRDISESLGKLPPQDLEIEEAILGALLIESRVIIEIAGILKVEHLYSEKHQEIYRAILELFSEGEKIDMRTVVVRLRKNGKLEMVGGAYYITELTSRISSSANIEYHCRIIIELSIKRSLILIASEMHHDAYEDTVDVFELYARINMKLQDVLDKAVSNRAEKSAKDLEVEFVKDIQNRMSGKHGGVMTGFPQYDRLMDGIHKTDLVVLAARPAMGKSVYAVQVAKQVAEQNIPVGIFSLEMGSIQLIGRLNIAESEMNADLIKKGQLQPHEFNQLMHGVGKISNLPIWIDDTPALNIVELRARAIRMKTKYNVRLIVVDYIQLVKGIGHGERGTNRDQEIGVITRTLKAIAKELDITVIALSQLSRDVEKRGGDKRPVLSDLRESGSIEQDADIVMFLYRPEYYKITVDSDGYPTQGLAEVIIAKHRAGDLDTIRQKFIGKQQRFAEWDLEYSGQPRGNQSSYVAQHYKSPVKELPSERAPEEMTDDSPF